MNKNKIAVFALFVSVNCFSATNFIYKGDEVIRYWNPSSGGLTIVENGVTNNKSYLQGREYIKLLVSTSGWTTNKVSIDTTNSSEILTNSVSIENQTNNPVVFNPLNTQRWISVERNEGEYCLIRIDGLRTLVRVVLEGAPTTFYKDSFDFTKQNQARERERIRLERWSDNLEYRNGQTLVGAGGHPDFVDAAMRERRQLNAEINNCNIQMRNFERDSDNLDRQIAAAKAKPAYHHPQPLKAYFTGRKQGDIPVWSAIK
jgi:hypothetical protein